MLGTVDFRSLGEDRRAPGGHQAVHGVAQCRVGGDARIAIGATALQADDQVTDADRLALHLIGPGQ
ncbi:hypothetical protein D3C80_1218700 [compost metagenome]